jgi:transcriptional regulator with XRE-family HTH domain
MPKKSKDEPAMARVRAVFEESGISLVELGKRMGYPDDTARQSAWQFMKSHDPRMSMLRRFAEAMRLSLDELTPRGKRMSRKLEDELRDCGCAMTPDTFREMLEERKAIMSPSWTIDDLVCNPDDAKNFCEMIRREANSPKMSDFLILRTLMNIRRNH